MATSSALQPDLFAEPALGPDGFRYQPDLIGAEAEAALAERLADEPFRPFDFHGYLANRKVVGFGLRYDYGARRVLPAPPIPDWLLDLRAAVAAFAGREPTAFVQVLMNEYEPGAGIG
jgi:alkylated DNA repair dioxygenase AlkB